VIDISTDDRAPNNIAYRYLPDGSGSDSDGDIRQVDVNWTPTPPEVQCLAFHPRGPWHVGKYITYDYDTPMNHYITLHNDMTGCFEYHDPIIQNVHERTLNGKFPSYPSCPYQLIAVGEGKAMGNYHPGPHQLQIPPLPHPEPERREGSHEAST
jgi:hypothetical protein